MSEIVSADLIIKVVTNCPHCEHYIDLLDSSDTNGYDHNEEGFVLSQACQTKYGLMSTRIFMLTMLPAATASKNLALKVLLGNLKPEP